MTKKQNDDKGYLIIFIIVSVLLIGLILRILIDTENFLKDIWFSFLGMVIIFIIAWISRNYKKE